MDQKIIGILGMLMMLHVMCYGVELLTSNIVPAGRWLVQFEKWAWRSGWMALGDLLRTACHGIGSIAGKA